MSTTPASAAGGPIERVAARVRDPEGIWTAQTPRAATLTSSEREWTIPGVIGAEEALDLGEMRNAGRWRTCSRGYPQRGNAACRCGR